MFFKLRGYIVLKMFTSKNRWVYEILLKPFDLTLDIYERIKYRKFYRMIKRINKILDQN